MPPAIAASSTGACAIRGGAARSHQQQKHQQPRRHQQLVLRTRAATPDLAGFSGSGSSNSNSSSAFGAARASNSIDSNGSKRITLAAAAAPAAAAAAAPPAAAAAPARKAPAPAAGPFTNTQRFVVAPSSAAAFQAAWREREAAMRQQPGFAGLSMIGDGEATAVEARWASVADFERWMLLDACRRSHLPPGVWQYVPRRGEGFPEDFVPFVAYDEPVNAKYL